MNHKKRLFSYFKKYFEKLKKAHNARVENLIDDEDFKSTVTREEFEAAIKGDIEEAMQAVKVRVITNLMKI